MRWAGRVIYLKATGKWTRLASPETPKKSLEEGASHQGGRLVKPIPRSRRGRVSCFVGFLTHRVDER